MIVDALVLAGGRGARLGGVSKGALVVDGRTLLERALDAASAARRVVVVGDPRAIADAAPGRALRTAREEPAFGGPAAGIAAGIAALTAESEPSDLVLVLACDLPDVSAAVEALLAAVDARGAVAIDASKRPQPLLALYPTAALVAATEAAGPLADRSVRSLVAGIPVPEVAVPHGSADDIDTWDDADAHGVAREGGPA